MTTISSELPAGNIRFVSQADRVITVEEDQRDSGREWFYWKFKAVFDAPGEYVFRFTRPWKVGPRGPAVSLDRGETWRWLADTEHADHQGFVYRCETAGEVWFCQGIPYLQREFDRFAAECAPHPAFALTELCRSRKGRPVELVTIREGRPKRAILLTARHHCQEMAADFVLEGILRTVLADDDFGRAFRREYALFAVPFVDKDGVIDGDQGKRRLPRDHARDYYGGSIYPETAAIRALIAREKPFLLLDLHCPWLRGGSNEHAYLVGTCVPRFQAEMARFARRLEAAAPACFPFRYGDLVHWGVEWNTAANRGSGDSYGLGIAAGSAEHPFVRFASTIEIPFANAGETTLDPAADRSFGAAVARTVAAYAEQSFEPDGRPVRIGFGDVQSAADLRVGFLLGACGAEQAAELAREGFSLIAVLPDRPGSAAELAETLKTLEAAGLDHTGTSRSPEEQERVMVRYAGGIRVGFVAASACGAPADAPFAVNDLPDLPRLIAQTRAAGAEYVVALIPGGSPETAAELHVPGADLTVSADGPGLTVVLTRQADALTAEIF